MPTLFDYKQLCLALWTELQNRVAHHGRPLIAVQIDLASRYSIAEFTPLFIEHLEQEGWSSVDLQVRCSARGSRIKTLEYGRCSH